MGINFVPGVVTGIPMKFQFGTNWSHFSKYWYTVLAGLVALAALTVHPALYGAVKTEGAVSARARGIAVMVSPVLSLLRIASLAATALVRPTVMNNYREHPVGVLVPMVVFGSLAAMVWAASKAKEKLAPSSHFIPWCCPRAP